MTSKPCEYCKLQIEIKKDETGKWKPFNSADGTKHWCDRNAKPSNGSTPVVTIEDLVRMIVRDEIRKMKT